MFNAQDFLNSAIQVAGDTRRIPIPPGEYVAQIGAGDGDITVTTGVAPKDNRPWARFEARVTIPDPSGAIKAATNRDPVVTSIQVMLDVTPEGNLDIAPGKNLRFNRLFEAAGWEVDEKNRLKPGYSPRWLAGKTLKVKIGHRPNPNDPAFPYEEVEQVTRA